jgi:hypothetical protein
MVCQWFGLKTIGTGFLVEPQNQGLRFVIGLASKPLVRVSRFGPQNRQQLFGDLGLKITMMVFWFWP